MQRRVVNEGTLLVVDEPCLMVDMHKSRYALGTAIIERIMMPSSTGLGLASDWPRSGDSHTSVRYTT